jgi:hypothetical protein
MPGTIRSTTLERAQDSFVESPTRANKTAVEVYVGNPGDISGGGGGALNTTATVTNITFLTQNVEQSLALPANCKGFIIRPRQVCRFYLSYTAGGPYFYCGLGSYFQDQNKYASQTVYFYCDKSAVDLDVITYV